MPCYVFLLLAFGDVYGEAKETLKIAHRGSRLDSTSMIEDVVAERSGVRRVVGLTSGGRGGN